MGNDYEKAVDTLLKDVKDLRADMKGIISALQRKAGDYVESTKESLHESVAHRPFVSLLAALGVGVVLGGLMRWHRR
jgi:ElaB/YqjD/DUF883 family membrane-anchored ribosome-binding protein